MGITCSQGRQVRVANQWRETGGLRRRLSTVVQRLPSFGAVRYLRRHREEERWRDHFNRAAPRPALRPHGEPITKRRREEVIWKCSAEVWLHIPGTAGRMNSAHCEPPGGSGQDRMWGKKS